MKKLSKLKRVEQPKPTAREACASCEAFAAECLTPIGDAAVPLCWLCAHHIVDHGCAPHRAVTAECECLPHQIYPDRPHPCVLNGNYVGVPQYVGKHSMRWDGRSAPVAAVTKNGPGRKPS